MSTLAKIAAVAAFLSVVAAPGIASARAIHHYGYAHHGYSWSGYPGNPAARYIRDFQLYGRT